MHRDIISRDQGSKICVSSCPQQPKKWVRTTKNWDLVVLLTTRYFGENILKIIVHTNSLRILSPPFPFPINIYHFGNLKQIAYYGFKMRATKYMLRTTRFQILVVLRLPTFDSNFATLRELNRKQTGYQRVLLTYYSLAQRVLNNEMPHSPI